jgi:hypothetical protein
MSFQETDPVPKVYVAVWIGLALCRAGKNRGPMVI